MKLDIPSIEDLVVSALAVREAEATAGTDPRRLQQAKDAHSKSITNLGRSGVSTEYVDTLTIHETAQILQAPHWLHFTDEAKVS